MAIDQNVEVRQRGFKTKANYLTIGQACRAVKRPTGVNLYPIRCVQIGVCIEFPICFERDPVRVIHIPARETHG